MRTQLETLAEKTLIVLAAALGFVIPAAVAGANGPKSAPDARYQLRTVRIENPWAAVMYRLDVTSGEVCAFRFSGPGAGEERGCVASAGDASPGSFKLEAVQGVRGTNQSSAYRLDRVTGEICRFQLSAASDSRLELLGCIAKPRAGDR